MPQHPNLRRNAMSIGVSLALSGAPAAVLAQENTLEEVVVTATKRERSVQDIPLSVTAVSGDSLVELNIQNGIDLPKAVPGLKLIYAGNSPQLILRGAGVAGLNDLAVPYYVDGLYRPRSAQALASWLDIDRVEVLRGPQGTLFGRNTLGGLVNIISNKPDTQAFDFGVAATGGDFDYQKFEGFVNVPLGDTMAFRVTASDTQRDPLVKNTYNSDAGLKDEDNTYARAQFRWEPTDGFDITLTATYWEDTANGNANFAYKPIGVSINPATGFTNGWSGNIQPRKGTWNGGDPSFNGGRAQAGDWPSNPTANTTPDDPHEIRSDFDNYRDLEETSWSALMNWDIGFATLRANVGYFEYESVNVFDVDLSPNPTEFLVQNGLGDDTAPCWYASRADMCGWVDGNQVNSEAIQADINLNSNGTGPLNWTLGYFLYDADDPDDNNDSYMFGYTDTTNPQAPVWAHWNYWDFGGTKSTAIYGQAEYDFTEKLTVTAGIRYSEDERNTQRLFIEDQPDRDFGFPWDSSPGDGRFDKVPDIRFFTRESSSLPNNGLVETDESHTDYRLAFDYATSDDVMVYGSFSTGYIAEGPAGGGTVDIVDANELDAFELGIKSTLLDGTMRLNAAMYYNEYDGLSTTAFEDVGTTILSKQVSGGSMTSQGLEIEMFWNPTTALRINAGIAIDDSELDDFAATEDRGRFAEGPYNAEGGYFPTWNSEVGDWTADGDPERIVGAPVYDLSGETAAFSPDYTVNLDVSYAIDMGGLGTLTPGVLMYHSADFKTMNVPYPFAEQDAYTVFDLRATWYTPIDRLTVQGFIKNATDEEYKVSQTVFSRGRVMADYGVQRNFGIRLGYNF